MEGILTIGEFTIISTYFSMILGAIRYFFGLGKSIQEMQVSLPYKIKIVWDMMKRLTFVFVYLIIVNIQLDESTIIKLLIYSYKEEAYLDN